MALLTVVNSSLMLPVGTLYKNALKPLYLGLSIGF